MDAGVHSFLTNSFKFLSRSNIQLQLMQSPKTTMIWDRITERVKKWQFWDKQ